VCSNRSVNFLDSIDVSGNNNNINYDLDTKQTNHCNEKRDGDKNSVCTNDAQKTINNLIVTGDNNPLNLIIKTEQNNDCDENSDGDNTLKCNNLSNLVITP